MKYMMLINAASAEAGDECTVEGSGVSGIDNCDPERGQSGRGSGLWPRSGAAYPSRP